ncbi:hypothetical protein [Cupriavidus nantongensis]|uniref:Uncharacterized protein n=1 Tax=Cupriavidus nantongensis TaxID=1796606 RepID=A0A142JMY0_9BURK|nr:hypothetical protein [Cupriavidus nantongensis]AMR79442.1 hypothetical protein A2G96_17790 [Cupriavidus nantongensis]
MTNLTLPRWVWYCLAAVLVLTGGLVYRSHVYDSGYDAGRAAAESAAATALAQARADDAAASADAEARLRASLKVSEYEHLRIQADLKSRLAASDLRVTRLSADIARLHDEAAGSARLPSDPAVPGGAAGADAADYSVADLILTMEQNYAICQRNSARLEGLQVWYRSLGKGSE